MSIGSQTQTEPAYLSSSVTSLHRSKKSTSEISKTYKHASQLYLTRRLLECYEALQPVITPPGAGVENRHANQSEDESKPVAPIATASTSQRIKIWSLYATLLNTIIELGDEEGKRDFGNKVYREIVRNVQTGDVWEQVLQNGYMGRESSIDAEVVYNLSNLLLAQAPNQLTNQGRLETYLSSSPHGNLDFTDAFQNGMHKRTNGMDTPKDLNSRVKILELFILHVLPRNNEWDYARSFVANSDILDEERREAFLQTLNELQEAKEQEDAEAEVENDLVGFAEETDDEASEQGQIRMTNDDVTTEDRRLSESPETTKRALHRRTSSEVDYGIEDDVRKSHTSQAHTQAPPRPPSTATTKATSSRTLSPPPTTAATSSSTIKTSVPTPSTLIPSSATPTAAAIRTQKPSTQPPTTNKKTSSTSKSKSTNHNNNKQQPTSRSRFSTFILILSNLSTSIAHTITRNPTQVFRTVMFLFAFLAVLARREVRERLKRVIGSGWSKVMATAGMGMKVSYV